ncbi:type 1 glutamine amidotransferase [Dongia sedimenti]|uniref:Type 1 glutamine amidotransferase n=1 Tax=Dongia sedimenti TaxID=3064282 RepID=A0ABU0YN87_9PROT|nr:type 1 glutamine amidotransferase [Rhodospirillaceae bacterium R-7]
MRFLVFQHIAIEHPGIFRDFFAADGIAWDAVELDEGEAIPDFTGPNAVDYDALWVMGGPMDVWEETEHPWLKAEKQAIRTWVQELGKPYMGLCLGHQLLGAALGGTVGKMEKPEVGILDIALTEAGRADPLFAGIADPVQALQWHGAAVLEAPEGAVILARSPACANQAMRIGARAYGLQYHTELTSRTVGEWGAVPAYAAALDQTLGQGALARLDAEATNKMSDFARDSRRLYDNFMNLLRTRS